MFSPDEQRKIQAKAIQQAMNEQKPPKWVIETEKWPFPLTSDDLAFLKETHISPA